MTSQATPTTVLSSEEAVRFLLDSNFDVDSQECILTLLKIIDNILSKPSNPKIRTLRMSNTTVRRKVLDRKGGLEVLFSIGFTYSYPTLPTRIGMGTRMEMDEDDGPSSSEPEAEAIVLEMGTEDMDAIASLRTLLSQTLRKDLGVARGDLPRPPPPQRVAPSTTGSTHPTVARPFDPFKSHSYNAQAAALGAPNPTSIRPDGSSSKRSDTEVRLEELEGRRRKMERDVQRGGGNGTMALSDRGIVACLPGDSSFIIGNEGGPPTSSSSSTGGRTSGDSSLLARQLTRKAEERKQREDGGFTTHAMRALTKLQKAKIYTHARLRICFPDGSSLSASFLPKETVAVVMEVIGGCLVEGGVGVGQAQGRFDLYVTPPRRKLEGGTTLEDEGLVPAAKVFVSWKGGGDGNVDDGVGTFLKRELFGLVDAPVVADISRTGDVSSYPQSRPLMGGEVAVKNAVGESVGDGGGGAAKKPSREEEMMQRMLGRGSGLGGRKLGGKRKPGGKIGGKKSN